MNCSDREKILSDYLDGALNPVERREMEEHLETCASCREVLELMKKTDRLSRESVLTDEPSPEVWAERWPGMRKRILAESERISRPPTVHFFPRIRLRPSLAIAAGVLLLAGVGLLWELFTPHSRLEEPRVESGGVPAEPARAEETHRGSEPRDAIILAEDIRKDLSLFRGIQQSFSNRVKWVTIDGELVNFDLAGREPERGADLHQALLCLDFKILRHNGEPEGHTVSSPRIIVRNSQEINNDFALPPESGLTYQLRTTPRIEAGGEITLDVDLVFYRIGDDGRTEARLSASPTVEPGKVTILGSVLPGDELYQIEVLTTVEQLNPSQAYEKM